MTPTSAQSHVDSTLYRNPIPERMLVDGEGDYAEFLRERRGLMAQKVRRYFQALKAITES
jgi:hypothetical protein